MGGWLVSLPLEGPVVGATVRWVPCGARGCGAEWPPYNPLGGFLAVATAVSRLGPRGKGGFKHGSFPGVGAAGVGVGRGGRGEAFGRFKLV